MEHQRLCAVGLYILTALLSTTAGCLCLYFFGIWPFGDDFFTYLDNAQLVASSVGSLKLVLEGVEAWDWTFLSGGVTRTPFLAQFHVLLCPVTWLACLFPSSSSLQTLSWMFLIQLVCCSLSALLYLRERFSRLLPGFQLLLALSYTFSHFLFSKYSFLPFLNVAIIFPLFLLSLERLLKQREWKWFLLISAYMLAVGPYFYWMWGIFSIVYIASWLRLGFSPHPKRLYLPFFAVVVVIAVCISAFSWLPGLMITADSARASMGGGLQWFGSINELSQFNPWMVSPLLFVSILLGGKSAYKSMWGRYGIALFVLVVCCCCRPTNWLFHMGAPVCFPVRFSYMISMMSCCLAADILVRTDNLRKTATNFKYVTGSFVIVVLFLSISVKYSCDNSLWFITFVASFVLWYKKYFSVSTCVVLVAACIQFISCYRFGNKDNMESQPERIIDAEALGREMKGHIQHSPWGRVKSCDMGLCSNFSAVSGLNSFCNYFNSSTDAHITTSSSLGYYKCHTRVPDCAGSLFSDSFMGVEFLVSRHTILDPLLERVPLHLPLHVYRNPYYWGDGVLLCSIKDEYVQPERGVLPNQQSLFEEIGGTGDLFQRCEMEISLDDAGNIYASYWTEGTEWLYANPYHIRFGCIQWYKERIAPIFRIELNHHKNPPALLQLPTSYDASDMRVRIAYIDSKDAADSIPTYGRFPVYRLNTQKMAELKEKNKGKVKVTAICGHIMEVEVRPEAGETYLLLPYFFQKGYRAQDESGRKLDVSPYHGFTLVTLRESKSQTVKLSYASPLSGISAWFSILGVLLIPGAVFHKRFLDKFPKSVCADWIGKVLAIGAIALAWCILTTPLWAKVIQLLISKGGYTLFVQ